MSLVIVGTNHKYSPIRIRERLWFSKKSLKDALRKLGELEGINAVVILSTCNRVELYADVKDLDLGIRTLEEFLSRCHFQALPKIRPYLYTYIGKEAILHLFNVAAGIDSQILGESQILEQVRCALEEAKEAGVSNAFLSRIFTKAIESAMKVKSKTGISEGNISVASIVIDLIREKFASLKNKKILIIGVGKISQLVVRELKNEETKVVFIANRTYERARELAGYIDAEVLKFEQLRQRLSEADIIISATSSPHLVLKKEDLIDTKKPLLIIDLAVPRDVAEEVKFIKGVKLYSLDELSFVIEKSLENRRKEIPKVEEIIKKELEDLCLSEPLELEPERACLP